MPPVPHHAVTLAKCIAPGNTPTGAITVTVCQIQIHPARWLELRQWQCKRLMEPVQLDVLSGATYNLTMCVTWVLIIMVAGWVDTAWQKACQTGTLKPVKLLSVQAFVRHLVNIPVKCTALSLPRPVATWETLVHVSTKNAPPLPAS